MRTMICTVLSAGLLVVASLVSPSLAKGPAPALLFVASEKQSAFPRMKFFVEPEYKEALVAAGFTVGECTLERLDADRLSKFNCVIVEKHPEIGGDLEPMRRAWKAIYAHVEQGGGLLVFTDLFRTRVGPWLNEAMAPLGVQVQPWDKRLLPGKQTSLQQHAFANYPEEQASVMRRIEPTLLTQGIEELWYPSRWSWALELTEPWQADVFAAEGMEKERGGFLRSNAGGWHNVPLVYHELTGPEQLKELAGGYHCYFYSRRWGEELGFGCEDRDESRYAALWGPSADQSFHLTRDGGLSQAMVSSGPLIERFTLSTGGPHAQPWGDRIELDLKVTSASAPLQTVKLFFRGEQIRVFRPGGRTLEERVHLQDDTSQQAVRQGAGGGRQLLEVTAAKLLHSRVRVIGYRWNEQAMRLLVESEATPQQHLDLKSDQPVNPVFLGLQPGDKLSAYGGILCRRADGQITELPAALGATGRIPAGSYVRMKRHAFGTPGVFVFQDSAFAIRNGCLEIGDPAAAQALEAGQPLARRYLLVVTHGGEQDPEDLFRSIHDLGGFDGSPGYQIALTRGEVKQLTYAPSLLAAEDAVIGTFDVPEELPNALGLSVEALNPRWSAGVWDVAGQRLVRRGAFDAEDDRLYTVIEPGRDQRLYVGSLLVADNPDVVLDVLQFSAEQIEAVVHNPTEKPLQAVVKPAPGLGIKGLEWQMQLAPGETREFCQSLK